MTVSICMIFCRRDSSRFDHLYGAARFAVAPVHLLPLWGKRSKTFPLGAEGGKGTSARRRSRFPKRPGAGGAKASSPGRACEPGVNRSKFRSPGRGDRIISPYLSAIQGTTRSETSKRSITERSPSQRRQHLSLTGVVPGALACTIHWA